MKSFFEKIKSCGILSVLVLISVLLTSCGYHVGSMMHPQIKTVGIAPVKNETLEMYASATLRGLLAERFQFDNSLKLVQPDEADCIVYAKIRSVNVKSVIWSSSDADQTFRPSQFEMFMSVEYTVKLPGQAKPLVPLTTITESCIYQFTNDPYVGKQSALKQISLRVANKIVTSVTEGW